MKKLDKTTAIKILLDVVTNDLRHADYDRVVAMADKLTKLITGENMDSLMVQFDRREAKDQFEQRKRITQHITGTVCKNLIKPTYEIPRSNGAKRVLKYFDDNENKKLKEFEDILSKFWGNKPLDDYLIDKWIDMVHSDPNGFVVYEWGSVEKGKHANPYPFEVSSEEAIYYQYDKNILQYLVVLNEYKQGAGGLLQKVTMQSKNAVKRFTIYFVGGSITFDELSKDDADKIRPFPIENEFNIEDIAKKNVEYINIAGTIYRVGIYNSELDFLPVVRVGYRLDIFTKGRTCISPIDEAVPILMKTVKANSELDLSMALHAHPQRVQYLQECDEPKCNKGRFADGSKCPVCDGTGMKKTPTTAQESIDLAMPRDREDMVTLENIVTYITPSVDLIRFQDDYIRGLTAQCKESIYNSFIYSRQEIAETATGKNIDMQNVYNSLYPMARAFSAMWEFSVKAVSKITDMYEGLVYSYIFSRDFKMKSLNDLYNDLKLVADSKAPVFVKQSIYDDIARINYTDDKAGYEKYLTMNYFYPYTGKTQEEIMQIINSVPPTDEKRILWEIFGWVFADIEMEYIGRKTNFYELSRSVQWKAIQKRIQKVQAEREGQPDFKEDVDADQ